ncbi:hypothetical protein [Microbispora sp. NPDC049125]
MAPANAAQWHDVIEGVCGDPDSPEFVARFAGRIAVLARLIGLEPA